SAAGASPIRLTARGISVGIRTSPKSLAATRMPPVGGPRIPAPRWIFRRSHHASASSSISVIPGTRWALWTRLPGRKVLSMTKPRGWSWSPNCRGIRSPRPRALTTVAIMSAPVPPPTPAPRTVRVTCGPPPRLNDSGDYVGPSRLPNPSTGDFTHQVAVIWAHVGYQGPVDLNTLVTNLDGRTLIEAFEISNRGFIVARATTGDTEELVLLVPSDGLVVQVPPDVTPPGKGHKPHKVKQRDSQAWVDCHPKLAIRAAWL